MTSIFRTTVTQRINNIKQPWGGYLAIKNFKVIYFQDDTDIDFLNLKNENISASLMGTVVDYLTRYYAKGQYGEKNSVLKAFDIAWLGARNLGPSVMDKASLIMVEIQNSHKFSDEVIIKACYLSSLDVAYRRGPQSYDSNINCIPDEITIEKIRAMVERSLRFFESIGGIAHFGFTLSTLDSKYINNGDGDFITSNGLWDLKVSVRKPTSKHTLQILIYYLMGLRTMTLDNDLVADLKNIKRLGIFNPRLNTSYTFDIENIDSATIEIVSKEVIGY